MRLFHELVLDSLAEDHPLVAILNEHDLRKRPAVQQAARVIDGVRHPLGYSLSRHLNVRKSEIEQFHPPARRPQAPHEAQITPPR